MTSAPSAKALDRRIRALLRDRFGERKAGAIWSLAAMLACAGAAAPVTAVGLVEGAPDQPAAIPRALRGTTFASPDPAAPAIREAPPVAAVDRAAPSAPQPAALVEPAGDPTLDFEASLTAIPSIIDSALAAIEHIDVDAIASATAAGARKTSREQIGQAMAHAREAMRDSEHIRAQVRHSLAAGRGRHAAGRRRH